MRFVLPLLALAGTAAALTASVTTYTNLAAYSAATDNTTVVSFNGLLASAERFASFNSLVVDGVTFTTPTPGTVVNVTAANYYSPNNYPNAFINNAGTTFATETLNVTLPSPTLALALDYGQLFAGGIGTITLSNGFTFNPATLPTVGNTAFIGFISTTPITGLTYVVSGGDWVVEDLRISTPAYSGPPPTISMSLSDPIIPAGGSATLTWSSTNVNSCTASGGWSGTQPTSGAQTISPGAPGYYTYSLTCSGSAGNVSLQSVVLTAFGPTPGIPYAANQAAYHKGYQASFYDAPPNQIVRLQTSLTVPPFPPIPSASGAVLFLWPGLDPGTNSVNLLPINDGVLQPVLTWGDSCAPTSQPTAFSSWWISAQYVNTIGNDPGYTGCFSGNSMLVAPGDVLLLDMELDANSGLWTQTVTDSNTKQSVTFSMNMEGQGQNWAYFAIEEWYGATISSPVIFSNTTITFQSVDTGSCSVAQGQNNAYIMTPPTLQTSGLQCFIGSIVLTQPQNQPVLTIAKSHTGSFTQGQQGATYTVTVSNGAGATPTSGTVTVTDSVPGGLTLGSMAGTGWNCSANNCTRSDALNAGSSYPPITVTVNVAGTATSPQVNQASVSGGGSATAAASDITTIASGKTETATIVSAANPAAVAIAPGSLATAYGKDLANSKAGGTSLPLPTKFEGTSVSIMDSSETTTLAPLLYVSPTQVNFEVPRGVATGAATVTVVSGDGTQSAASVQIATVAPGLFELNSTGLAAAYVILYHANGTQTVEQVYKVTGGDVVATPVSLGSSTDKPYLFLFGTGFEAAGTAGVKVSIGGTNVPVAFAGSQGGFVGLDQANVELPASLTGKGKVTIQLMADGLAANAVNITIQ
jgi:uncharacterized protein (TIGR03437 family)